MNLNESYLNLGLAGGDPSETAQKYITAKRETYTSLRAWEINRRQAMTSLRGIADNLFKTLQTINKNSQERLTRLDTYFKQFKMPFKSTFSTVSNFQEFKFQRTKKQANNRRTVVENNELYDLIVNFKEELEEFEERKKTVEKVANEEISARLLKEAIQPTDDAVGKLTLQAQNTREKAEKYEPTLVREFDSLIEQCIRSLEKHKNGSKTSENDIVTRTTFEPFCTFLCIARNQTETIKSYCLAVVSLLEQQRKLEIDRATAIKQSVEKFSSALGAIYGDGIKCFGVSKYLGETLDPERLGDFQFDLPALMLSPELDAIQRRVGAKEVTPAVFREYINSFSFDDVTALINSLTVEKFKGRLQETDGSFVPATLYLTVENTLVLYKQAAMALHVATIFPETLMLTKEQDGMFSLKFVDKNSVWNSNKSLRMQLTKPVVDALILSKERVLAILSVEPMGSTSGLSADSFSKVKGPSIDDIR